MVVVAEMFGEVYVIARFVEWDCVFRCDFSIGGVDDMFCAVGD